MPSTSTVTRHRLTVTDFHRMGEAGILHEDDRVELIEGELIDMAPIGSRHASKVIQLTALFNALLSGRAIVSPQNPVRLGTYSEPQPDIAILRFRDDYYAAALPQPEDVLLLVEVADTTLQYDRDIKMPLYARHGIPEVWLVDVQHERVEMYLEPGSDGYRHIHRPDNTEQIAPSLLPDLFLRLSDLWTGQAP
jgi:Uma2 family endonuclease